MITIITILEDKKLKVEKDNKKLEIDINIESLVFRNNRHSAIKFINKNTEMYKIMKSIVGDFDYYYQRVSI
jgi:hypothetical protein